MDIRKKLEKLKIWDGTKTLDILEEGDSASAKGILVFGKDVNGNVIPLRIIAEGDSLTNLEGILFLGKDVNGDALPISIITEGDSLTGLTGLLSYGKDASGDALPFSVVSDGDSTAGLKGILIFGEDSDGNISPVQINGAVKGLKTVDAAHGEIHDGRAFTHSEKHATIADGADFDVLMINPADNEPHFRYIIISSGAEVDILLFEGTTVSANGAALTVFNNNRNSVITNNMTLFSGPTITDDGTQIEFNLIAGERKVGGTGDSPVVEWVLKQNTNYLLRVTNNSGGVIDIGHTLFWYEPV